MRWELFAWFGRRGEVLLLVRVRAASFLVGRLEDKGTERFQLDKVAHSPPLPASTDEVLGILLK